MARLLFKWPQNSNNLVADSVTQTIFHDRIQLMIFQLMGCDHYENLRIMVTITR